MSTASNTTPGQGRPDHDRPDHDRLERVKTTALPVPHADTAKRERDHGPIHPPCCTRGTPDHGASGEWRPSDTHDAANARPGDAPRKNDAGKDEAGKDRPTPGTPRRPSGVQVSTGALKNPTDETKADVANLESFPASDPPAHGGST